MKSILMILTGVLPLFNCYPADIVHLTTILGWRRPPQQQTTKTLTNKQMRWFSTNPPSTLASRYWDTFLHLIHYSPHHQNWTNTSSWVWRPCHKCIVWCISVYRSWLDFDVKKLWKSNIPDDLARCSTLWFAILGHFIFAHLKICANKSIIFKV